MTIGHTAVLYVIEQSIRNFKDGLVRDILVGPKSSSCQLHAATGETAMPLDLSKQPRARERPTGYQT